MVLPELACLRIAVFNEEGKQLGMRILPFNDLQSGYRHISLKTQGNYPMSLPMIFCCFETKIYVPDGLGGKENQSGLHLRALYITLICFFYSDFMDALCDPRAFLSAQEKRAEQLKALGIEENDISGDVIESKGGDKKGGDGKGGDAKAGAGGKKEEKKGRNLSCSVNTRLECMKPLHCLKDKMFASFFL